MTSACCICIRKTSHWTTCRDNTALYMLQIMRQRNVCQQVMSWKRFAKKVAQFWLHRNTYSLLWPIRPWAARNLPCGSTSLLPLLTSPVLIYTLTCAEWRDVSNHGRVSTIQSRLPEKKAKNHVMLTRKLPWKYCSTSHLPFLSSNRKIVRAFLKLFPPNEAYGMPSNREKMRQEKRKKREERKRKVKVKTAMSLWNPKTWKLKFCFLRMPQLHKLVWIRGPLT